MDVQELIGKYLKQKRLMQLATQADGKLWACTVHFYSDDDLNLYWVSNTRREHSQHITQNSEVAAAILVHEDNPAESYAIGISLTGTAEAVGVPDEAIAQGYITKLDKDPDTAENIRSGKANQSFYRLTPKRIVLYDDKDFPDSPRQELNLEADDA